MSISIIKKDYVCFLLLILCLICLVTPATANNIVPIAQFSRQSLDHWKKQIFKSQTHYEFTTLHNIFVLKAISHDSASGFVKKVHVDLVKTPFLNWHWQVDHSLHHLAENTKSGDDYAARIYIAINGGIFFWRTLALSYVWSSDKPKGAIWDNAFSSHVKMLAIESGNSQAGKWDFEKRNVRVDLQKSFGRDFRYIDAVAIMTDTDSSGQSTTAYYGDIYFSAQ